MLIRVCANTAHNSCLDHNASYKAAEWRLAKFLWDVVDEIWYNNLKNATAYTKVTVINIMALLDANSKGLHAHNMITLHKNMMQYYVQADVS